jgi:thiamine monophosphate kinase
MTFPEEDMDRIRQDYTDGDETSLDQVRSDLDSAGFDPQSADAAAEAIAADQDLAISEEARLEAQRQAVDSLGDAGAIGGEVVRGEGGTTVGKPGNVEQEIQRTGPQSGDVIAVNKNTGTSAKIGEVDLADPGSAIE